jgi:hypothetical protein
MNAWDGAILALLGMLGGVLLVVLVQLVGALRATRRLLEELAPELKKTARETSLLAENLNTLAAPIAAQGEGVARFLSALDRLAGTLDKLNHMAQTAGMVAAAVAPAVTAAIGAVRRAGAVGTAHVEEDPDPTDRDPEEPSPEPGAEKHD